MAWTAPRTWVTGEIATAAELNTHIRDNENFLYHGVVIYSAGSDTAVAGADSVLANPGTATYLATQTKVEWATTMGALASEVVFALYDGGAQIATLADAHGGVAGPVSGVYFFTPGTAGSHAYQLVARTGSGTVTAYAPHTFSVSQRGA